MSLPEPPATLNWKVWAIITLEGLLIASVSTLFGIVLFHQGDLRGRINALEKQTTRNTVTLEVRKGAWERFLSIERIVEETLAPRYYRELTPGTETIEDPSKPPIFQPRTTR